MSSLKPVLEFGCHYVLRFSWQPPKIYGSLLCAYSTGLALVRIALHLSFEGIELLHRQATGGWASVVRVPLDSDDLKADLVQMRFVAAERSDPDFSSVLILPNEHVKYLTMTPSNNVEVGVRKLLDGATPYRVEELTYDYLFGQDDIVKVAATTLETVEEAISFAAEHGFNPSGVIGIQNEPGFRGIFVFQGDASALGFTDRTFDLSADDSISEGDFEPEEQLAPQKVIPPEPSLGLPLTLQGGKIELDLSPHGQDENPLRMASFRRLQKAVVELVRHGNQYPELRSITESLLNETSGNMADASFYHIHLDVAALTDLIDSNPKRREVEQIDPDTLASLMSVVRLGPPLTIDDPLVVEFEEAHKRYSLKPRDSRQREDERSIVTAIAKDNQLFGERLREISQMLSAQPESHGRAASANALIAKNAVVQAGLIVGGIAGAAVVGHISIEAAKSIWTAAPSTWSFLVANKDAIIAASLGWGQQAQIWTADLMARGTEIAQLVNHTRNGFRRGS